MAAALRLQHLPSNRQPPHNVVVSRPRRLTIIQMKQLTAIVHRGEPEEGGFWATCLEVPGANGQGETKEECLADLKDAVQLLLETERQEIFRLDPNAETAELVLA